MDHVRAEVEHAVPTREHQHSCAPDVLRDLDGQDVDEETEEPVEGQVRERNAALVDVFCQFGELLGQQEGEDLLVHAHSELTFREKDGNTSSAVK